uniref:Uncharacterized protein n=1 Tax=Anguilla anguilla TaxID=7936 RepID=A0A0E9RPC5_ANGAN
MNQKKKQFKKITKIHLLQERHSAHSLRTDYLIFN